MPIELAQVQSQRELQSRSLLTEKKYTYYGVTEAINLYNHSHCRFWHFHMHTGRHNLVNFSFAHNRPMKFQILHLLHSCEMWWMPDYSMHFIGAVIATSISEEQAAPWKSVCTQGSKNVGESNVGRPQARSDDLVQQKKTSKLQWYHFSSWQRATSILPMCSKY